MCFFGSAHFLVVNGIFRAYWISPIHVVLRAFSDKGGSRGCEVRAAFGYLVGARVRRGAVGGSRHTIARQRRPPPTRS